MSEELDTISQRQAWQTRLKSLDAFIGSPAYRGYIAARTQEIQDVKDAIILNDPFDRATEIEQFKMRGELKCLEEMLTTFEDARVILRKRIEDALDREAQTRSKENNETK